MYQSDENEYKYDCPKYLSRQIKVQQSDETLSITNKNRNEKSVTIYLTVKNIESLKTVGNVEIETSTNITLNKLNLTIDDESMLNLYVNSNDFKFEVFGSGEVNLAGIIDTLRLYTHNESEIYCNLKSRKVLCRLYDLSNVSLKGTIFNLYISSFNNSNINALNSNIGSSFVTSFDDSQVKVTSVDAPEIYSFDKSAIYYKSPFKANISKFSDKSVIKKDLTRK